MLPAAKGAGGGAEPVGTAGAEKVTEAVGRVVVRAGGACSELGLNVDVVRRWWLSAEAMSAAVARWSVMLCRRRPERSACSRVRSACSRVREAARACRGCRTPGYSSSARERAQASAAIRS